ncbi:uncharacterized protein LOC143250969 isoform X2 [Tachypleus tridentatus]|uniref:uncharacterized protein LOC143250969 isoform X2 n=1 Tax=Tachypleus tridentatus TaxID=6853 RepID=UPI003FD01064
MVLNQFELQIFDISRRQFWMKRYVFFLALGLCICIGQSFLFPKYAVQLCFIPSQNQGQCVLCNAKTFGDTFGLAPPLLPDQTTCFINTCKAQITHASRAIVLTTIPITTNVLNAF